MDNSFEGIEKFNEEVKILSDKGNALLTAELGRLNIGQRGNLLRSIKNKSYKKFGMVDHVSFQFLRYGYFVEKGVGRGYPIASVSAGGPAISSAGGHGRIPKPWIRKPIDQFTSELADFVMEAHGDMAVKFITAPLDEPQ